MSIRLVTRTKIEEESLAAETGLAKQRSDAETERSVYAAQQELLRLQEEEKLFEERRRIEVERIADEYELERQRVSNQLQLRTERHQTELEELRQKLEVEATMTSTNIKKAVLDSVEEIYKSLPIETVKLINLGPNQGVESLLTQVMATIREAGGEAG